MIDGRSVYSPLFSGVFWDEPNVLLDDVERIEVISGPGGTLWGVNAVNGVINITTRHAGATLGDLLTLRATSNGAQAAFRHGDAGRDGAWRVYGKVFSLAHSDDTNGHPLDDEWTQGQIGARADWARGPDRYSVNANAWRGGEGRPALGVIAPPDPPLALADLATHGVNATGRWEHALDDGASLAVQAYYDMRYRSVPPTFSDTIHIADLQLQHTLAAPGRQSIVWGGEYRYSWDHVDNSPNVAILPASERQAWASLFAQDEITLRPDLRLTAGARYERNPYTGVEFLPNLRLSWRATPAHAFWTALSRTVRAPTRLDVDSYVPGQPPYRLAGGRDVRAETARVLEIGYRGQIGSGLSYSVTAYRNLYDHLRTQDVSLDGPMLVSGNGMTGRAHGIEAWGNVQVSGSWRIAAGLTALHEKFALKPGTRDVASLSTSGRDPAYSAQLRSSHTLDGGRELEFALRHVAALSAPAVVAYTAFDARFGWRPASGVEVSVFGANLNGGHAEYGLAPFRAEVPRMVGVKVVWQR